MGDTTAAEKTSLPVRILTWALTVLAVVAVLAALLYNLGGPMPPTAEQRAGYERAVAAGEAQPVGSGGFTIPIPGCRCHSDRDEVVVQHSNVHVRDCMKCHGG